MAEIKLSHNNPSGSYVYEVIVDGVVRYIGKGTGRRFKVHATFAKTLNAKRASGSTIRTSVFYDKLSNALKSGANITYRIVAEGLSHEGAFSRECQEIEAISDPYQLWNEVPGGEGFSLDRVKDPESFRRKLIDGIKRSWENPERTKLASEAAKKRWANAEARSQHSILLKKSWDDAELRRKHRELVAVRRGSNISEYQRIAANIRWSNPSNREKMSNWARAKQLERSAKKRACLYSGVLSFGA